MKAIVIATAGWVFIGELKETKTGVELTDASVIRKWGTTAGLGQIALSGPTSETILDKCGTVKIPTCSIIGIIDCVV